MALKEQMDQFYQKAKWLLEHYEQIVKEAEEADKRGILDAKAVDSLQQTLVDVSRSVTALAAFHHDLHPLEERLRGLEKQVREEVLAHYAEAGATWDTQRAATEKLVARMKKLQETARPFQVRVYPRLRELPMALLKSRHPHGQALMPDAERAVKLLSDALLRSDLTVPLNDLMFGVEHRLSQLTGK